MVALNVSEPIRNAKVTVDAASQLLSYARKRTEIFLTNRGATNITISIGTPAVLDAGIVIGPSGFWFSTVSQGYPPPDQDIYVISDAAGGILAVLER